MVRPLGGFEHSKKKLIAPAFHTIDSNEFEKKKKKKKKEKKRNSVTRAFDKTKNCGVMCLLWSFGGAR